MILAKLRDRLAARPSSPFFADNPARPGGADRRYMIATSGRTGSELLCSRIAEYGQLGFPMEFLNTSYIAEFDRLFPNPSLDDFERYVQSQFSSPATGVFGIKTDWWHFREASQLGLFPSFLQPLDLIVHLRRDDFVGQAVSFELALKSGVWHLRDAFTSADDVHAGQAYDPAAIKAHARNILNQEYYWRQHFKQVDTPIVEATYEQLSADVDQTIRQIAQAFDIKLQPRRNAMPDMRKTRSNIAVEWTRRFHEDCEDFVSFWHEYRGLASAA